MVKLMLKIRTSAIKRLRKEPDELDSKKKQKKKLMMILKIYTKVKFQKVV